MNFFQIFYFFFLFWFLNCFFTCFSFPFPTPSINLVPPKQLKIYQLKIPIWSLLELTNENNYQQYFSRRFQLNLKRLFSNNTDDLDRIENWFQSLIPMELNTPIVSEMIANSYHYHHQSLMEVNVDELIYTVFMCESIGGKFDTILNFQQISFNSFIHSIGNGELKIYFPILFDPVWRLFFTGPFHFACFVSGYFLFSIA